MEGFSGHYNYWKTNPNPIVLIQDVKKVTFFQQLLYNEMMIFLNLQILEKQLERCHL